MGFYKISTPGYQLKFRYLIQWWIIIKNMKSIFGSINHKEILNNVQKISWNVKFLLIYLLLPKVQKHRVNIDVVENIQVNRNFQISSLVPSSLVIVWFLKIVSKVFLINNYLPNYCFRYSQHFIVNMRKTIKKLKINSLNLISV